MPLARLPSIRAADRQTDRQSCLHLTLHSVLAQGRKLNCISSLCAMWSRVPINIISGVRFIQYLGRIQSKEAAAAAAAALPE
jgi:hypothetical protein